MPKKSWGSIAQKRAQQKAAEASARKRKKRGLSDILKRKKRAEGSFSATRKDSVKIAREHDLSGANRSEANKAAYRASGGAAKTIRASGTSKTTADRTYSAAKSLQLKAPTTKRGSRGKVGLSTRVSTPDNYKKASTGRDIGKDKPFSGAGLAKLNSATEKRTREELSKMSDAEIHKLAYKDAHPDRYSGVGLRHKWAAEEAKKRKLDVSSNPFARGSQAGTESGDAPKQPGSKKTSRELYQELSPAQKKSYDNIALNAARADEAALRDKLRTMRAGPVKDAVAARANELQAKRQGQQLQADKAVAASKNTKNDVLKGGPAWTKDLDTPAIKQAIANREDKKARGQTLSAKEVRELRELKAELKRRLGK